MDKLVCFLLLASVVASASGSRRELQTSDINREGSIGIISDVVSVETVEATPAADLFGPAPPRVVESPPTALECGSGLEGITLEDIQNQLIPCVFGVVPSCCDRLAPVFRIGEGKNSPLEGCLCNELFLSETVREIEEMEITELVGFDGTRFLTVLQGCNINFFFGEGNATCPGIIPSSVVGDTSDDQDDDDDDDDDDDGFGFRQGLLRGRVAPGVRGMIGSRFG